MVAFRQRIAENLKRGQQAPGPRFAGRRRRFARLSVRWFVRWSVALLLFAGLAHGQQQDQNNANAMARVTVRGVVLNTASGEPLARALVRLAGEGGAGTLTDGEGRYELADVVTGPQQFEVIKPGFLDATAEAAAPGGTDAGEYAHTVMVGAGMPDLTFRMEPANAIHGVVQLSTGDTAEGIDVTLLRQTVLSGRFSWQAVSTIRTNAEGAYRFGNLADGVYALYTLPAMENDTLNGPIDRRHPSAECGGYASEFYPGVRDVAGAVQIQVHGGQQAEANFSLTLETFHSVEATVSVPDDASGQSSSPERPGAMLSAVADDSQGHQLPYAAQYDQSTHTVRALLPDGNYVLIASAGRPKSDARRLGISGASREAGPSTGAVEFSMSGHAVSNLRIGLAGAARGALQVNLERSTGSATAPSPSTDDHSMVLTISQAGGSVTGERVGTFAVGSLAGSVITMSASAGSYWVHTNLADKHYCADSLLAGGSNLAREPLTLAVSGSAAPLTLNVRDDCAKLTLALPAAAEGSGLGEEPFYTVYAVPDFDSTEDVIPQTLRPSTGGKVTLEGLTPGSYHVYAFDRPVAFAYREKAALDAWQGRGQAVDLAPGQAANLVVEVPQ